MHSSLVILIEGHGVLILANIIVKILTQDTLFQNWNQWFPYFLWCRVPLSWNAIEGGMILFMGGWNIRVGDNIGIQPTGIAFYKVMKPLL